MRDWGYGWTLLLAIPAAGLIQSARTFNEGQAKGSDVYSREHMPLPLAQPL